MNKPDIIIIGGGISGITTALTLQLLGYKTSTVAEYYVEEDTPRDPRFASLYPAASVIPHSVNTDRMKELFAPSHEVYEFLYRQNVPSIRLHRHYEVYEFQVDDPSYASYLDGYERIEQSDDPCIPRYDASLSLYGWVFNCLVAEWPFYIRQLYKWYEQSGGCTIRKKLTSLELRKMDASIVVNCGGVRSLELFQDPEPPTVERGHLLFVKDAPLITHSNGMIASYNYTPKTDVYSDPHGRPADLYFYPRSNGWIVGGSRQKGIINERNEFEGREYTDTLCINGITMPRQILELNRNIVECTFTMQWPGEYPIESRIGYRFIRNLDGSGLRTDTQALPGKTVVHNYGHGGAGVTLSWGCALEVAKLVSKAGGSPSGRSTRTTSELLQSLQGLLVGLCD